MIQKIESKLDSLNRNRDWQSVLSPWLRTKLTYTSNSLEGNTLSLIETRIVVEDGQGVAGKSLREIYEAQNHAMAFDYVQNSLSNKKTQELSEQDLLHLHILILDRIDNFNAGKYRNSAVRIGGSQTIFPNYLKVPDFMSEIFDQLSATQANTLEEVLNATISVHLKVVKIHPFTDGNGRTARLFMNTVMMQNNLAPIDILPETRREYLESLENSTTESYPQFTSFILQTYNSNLDTYLATFTG